MWRQRSTRSILNMTTRLSRGDRGDLWLPYLPEQIAILAHKLGKDLSLDEGNKLRKLLTKKGTGKGHEAKMKIHSKFITGCVEKGIRQNVAEEIWNKFEYFSGYGFNKSHAVSYSMLSYQCAWLAHHHPAEWMAAFLDKEPESRKEKAINIAKGFGFGIRKLDVNTSGRVWEISEDGETLIQPLTSIKGLGDAAIAQIVNNAPLKKVEDFILTTIWFTPSLIRRLWMSLFAQVR